MQYKFDVLKDITSVGLFHWDYRPNKWKPEKPRRVPRLGNSFEFVESDFNIGVFFYEDDYKTLHVFESFGYDLSGIKIAKEYIYENELFKEKRTLLSMISWVFVLFKSASFFKSLKNFISRVYLS
jgi:hypothetical protein